MNHLRTLVSGMFGVAILAGASLVMAQEPKKEEEKGSTYEVEGRKITLFKPRLVHRSAGFLWFPSLDRLSDGRWFAVMSTYADQAQDVTPSVFCFSTDQGRTWSKPVEGQYGELALNQSDGSTLLMPYYLRFQSDDRATGVAQRIAPRANKVEPSATPVEVSGWPRKIGLLDADLGGKPEWKLASFVFNGQTVRSSDDKAHLATLYGRFAGTRRYSLVLAESADGLKWKIRSIIADEKCPLRGGEGPCESALVRLKDGRLLCVYRLDSGVPYGHNFSSDDGKTWSDAKPLDGPYSVQPSLAVSAKNGLLLSGGRPGLLLWWNPQGDAIRWHKVDVQAHHNRWIPDDPISKAIVGFDSNSSSYTEIRWIDDRHFLMLYDRLASGWQAIPKNSPATNSVWIVHGRID